MYRIEISSFEKYIDTFRYQQKIKRYDIISIYRPTLSVVLFGMNVKAIEKSSSSGHGDLLFNRVDRIMFLLVFAVALFAICVNGNSLPSMIDDGSVEIISLNESQYCFVNQNTIRVRDNFTSELQDIVNKTEHVIISTTINSTVIFIAPSNGSRCSEEDDNIGVPTPVYIILVVLDAITILIAVANITLHLLIKELRTVSGILIMMMCGSVVLVTIVSFVSFTYSYVAEEEQYNSVCIVFINLSYYILFVYQAIKLGILFHFTYLMY